MRREAFTMTELCMAFVLFVIAFAFFQTLHFPGREGPGPVEFTKVTLKTAKAAATEYEVCTGIVINHHDHPAGFQGFDWNIPLPNNKPGATGVSVMQHDGVWKGGTGERFVWAVLREPSAAKILRSVERDALGDMGGTSGQLDLLDGWGNPIRYAAFVEQDAVMWDDDLPARKGIDPFFSSAGSDGKWGTILSTGVPDADAADNIHSFNLGE